jgi:hypothetical protein
MWLPVMSLVPFFTQPKCSYSRTWIADLSLCSISWWPQAFPDLGISQSASRCVQDCRVKAQSKRAGQLKRVWISNWSWLWWVLSQPPASPSWLPS